MAKAARTLRKPPTWLILLAVFYIALDIFAFYYLLTFPGLSPSFVPLAIVGNIIYLTIWVCTLYDIYSSDSEISWTIQWSMLVFWFPLLGLILYWVFGRRSRISESLSGILVPPSKIPTEMSQTRLVEYIRRNVGRGFYLGSIIKELKKVGYSDKEIDAAVKAI